MSRGGAVASFTAALWALRESGGITPRTALSQGRMLYAAAWRDVEDRPGYDPEADPRLDWARAVLAAARAGAKRPLGRSEDEAVVEMMLREGDFKDFTTEEAKR